MADRIDKALNAVSHGRRRTAPGAKRRKLMSNDKAGTREHVEDYALFSQGAYLQSESQRSKLMEDFNTGYVVDHKRSTDDFVIYKIKNPTANEPDFVMAFRGTSKLRDLMADGRIAVDEIENSPRYKNMLRAFDAINEDAKAYGQTITLTGHSLGGSLAAAVGAARKVPSVTFNPGSGMSTLTGGGEDLHNSLQYTTNGSDQTDPISWLSSLGARPGETVVTVGDTALKKAIPNFSLGAHSLSNFLPAPRDGSDKEKYYSSMASTDDIDSDTSVFKEAHKTMMDAGIVAYNMGLFDHVKDYGKHVFDTVMTQMVLGAGLEAMKKAGMSTSLAAKLKNLAEVMNDPVKAGAEAVISGVGSTVRGAKTALGRMMQLMYSTPERFKTMMNVFANGSDEVREGIQAALRTRWAEMTEVVENSPHYSGMGDLFSSEQDVWDKMYDEIDVDNLDDLDDENVVGDDEEYFESVFGPKEEGNPIWDGINKELEPVDEDADIQNIPDDEGEGLGFADEGGSEGVGGDLGDIGEHIGTNVGPDLGVDISGDVGGDIGGE